DRGATVGVGPELLGRVLDAFGNSLDGGPRPELTLRYPIHRAPPPAFGRKAVSEVFSTGVRAVVSMVTFGIGHRLGVFAGAGVGQGPLSGMICRSSQADINVVGLIGERGREVSDLVRQRLGPESLARSVVLAATSDQPPLVRAHGAEAATSVAEYFRD